MRFKVANFGAVWTAARGARWEAVLWRMGPDWIVSVRDPEGPRYLDMTFRADGSGRVRGNPDLYGEVIRRADRLLSLRQSLRLTRQAIGRRP